MVKFGKPGLLFRWRIFANFLVEVTHDTMRPKFHSFRCDGLESRGLSQTTVHKTTSESQSLSFVFWI